VNAFGLVAVPLHLVEIVVVVHPQTEEHPQNHDQRELLLDLGVSPPVEVLLPLEMLYRVLLHSIKQNEENESYNLKHRHDH